VQEVEERLKTLMVQSLTGNERAYRALLDDIAGREDFRKKSLDRIVEFHQEKQALESEIEKLKQQISRSKSFKEKVELNLKLKEKERELIKITKL